MKSVRPSIRDGRQRVSVVITLLLVLQVAKPADLIDIFFTVEHLFTVLPLQ